MERLTCTNNNGCIYFDVDGTKIEIDDTNILKVAKKLKEYEDLDERGLIKRLPCKEGDKVYKIINQRDNFDDSTYKIVSAVTFRLSMIDEVGKTIFITKDEADKKLE